MEYDIPESIPQGSDGAQEAENRRIVAIANELNRLCRVHEAQFGSGQPDVILFETEQHVAEQMAKAQGFWIPMLELFRLGVPGPSGHENDTYVAEKVVYKVNNLLNSGSIAGMSQDTIMIRYGRNRKYSCGANLNKRQIQKTMETLTMYMGNIR